LNWLVYILPPLAFLAGAIVLWRTVRNWRSEKSPPVIVKGTSSDDPYVARIEEELRRRERGGA
jgi:hypothetical protein